MAEDNDLNCPRCGQKGVEELGADTAGDKAVSDFHCSKCQYDWNWREGSAYPETARAKERDRLAAETASPPEPTPATTPAETPEQ